MSGLFVVFEGGDSVGKTTQVDLLSRWLDERGLAHVRTRQPGGTEVGAELRPSAVDGAISLEPVAVTLGGSRIDAADLRAIPAIGDAVAGLLSVHTVCIADSLPASLRLTDLALRGGQTTLVIRGTAVPTDEASLAARGSC